MTNDRIICRKELCALLGVGSEAIRRYIKKGKIPPPDVDLSLRMRAWRLSTLCKAGIGLV